MFGRKNEFPLPELPDVCLKCGARGPLSPARFGFRYSTASSQMLVFLSPLLGAIVARRMTHRRELPVCGGCSAHLRRAKYAALLSVLLFFPTLPLTASLVEYNLLFLFTPFAYIIAAYAYHAVERGRGTPKLAQIDKDHLVLSVPGHGALVLFEREPETGRKGHRRSAPAAPALNRSICGGCGFINFPGVAECKKCHTPLGQAAAA